MFADRKDIKRIQEAEAWLELGNVGAASVAFDNLPTQLKGHPLALHVQWGICIESKRFQEAMRIAKNCASTFPFEAFGHEDYAWSLHKLGYSRKALVYLRAYYSTMEQ